MGLGRGAGANGTARTSHHAEVDMNNHQQDSPLIRVAELADYMGLPKPRVYQLAREGILPCVRLGRAVRFDPIVIQDFIRNGGATFAHGWRKDPLP